MSRTGSNSNSRDQKKTHAGRMEMMEMMEDEKVTDEVVSVLSTVNE